MLSHPDGKNEYNRRINLALNFIENSYSENISLKDIADSAFFSVYHFHRIFSSFLGETPGDYLRRIRLEKAANLLNLQPDYSITRIAIETGFSSSAAFSRSFQNYFGISAKTFRKKKINQNPSYESKDNFNFQNINNNYYVKEIRQLPLLRLAYVRSMSGYGYGLEKVWNTLFSWAYPKGIINSTTRLFGIPLDDPEITDENRCRYFAAITIDENTIPSGQTELMVLEKGWYAEFLFSDKISEIKNFYKFVYGTWLPQSGYIPDDRPSLEEYPITNSKPSKTPIGERMFTFSFFLPIRPI